MAPRRPTRRKAPGKTPQKRYVTEDKLAEVLTRRPAWSYSFDRFSPGLVKQLARLVDAGESTVRDVLADWHAAGHVRLETSHSTDPAFDYWSKLEWLGTWRPAPPPPKQPDPVRAATPATSSTVLLEARLAAVESKLDDLAVAVNLILKELS